MKTEYSRFSNKDVLDFYRKLPFNLSNSIYDDVTGIKNGEIEIYPQLSEIISKNTSILEVGCGTGWLSNTLAFRYKCPVTAIDLNPIAIRRAKKVAQRLKILTHFEEKDLFLYEPEKKFDVVVSFGVLHHTDNCLLAIERICSRFLKDNGCIMMGLYHKYGRKPFLEHFFNMKKNRASNKEMYNEFLRLHGDMDDKIRLRSWFRDQVLIPHETQHTLSEIMPILNKANMKLLSTSLNRFKPIVDIDDVLSGEREWEETAKDKLNKGYYFPGFFTFLAQKEKK
jgi:SAM-dependent methyltransferase